MKKYSSRVSLGQSSLLLLYSCKAKVSLGTILIVPNTAGYYAIHKRVGKAEYVKASEHIDVFCLDLAKHYDVFYVILPGQAPSSPHAYSYESSVTSVLDAIQFIRRGRTIVGVMGMCTGGAIAADAMTKSEIADLPLIIYNTAAWVGWSNPDIQKLFQKKYPGVNLDCEKLLLAPMPGDIFRTYPGTKILQILGGTSSYPLVGTPERPGQNELGLANKNIKQVLFRDMGDVPDTNSPEYELMLKRIRQFFAGDQVTKW